MKKKVYKFEHGAEMYFTHFAIKNYLRQLEDIDDNAVNLIKLFLERTKRGLERCMDTWGVDYSDPAIYNAKSEEE